MALELGWDSGNTMTFTRRASIFAAFGLFLTPLAEARRGGRRVSFSGRGLANGVNYSGPVLSREQLKMCIDQQNRINSLSAAVDKEQESLEVEQGLLRRLEHKIESDRAFVNTYSQESVDSFNRSLDEHRRKVAAFNKRLSVANEKVERLNSSVSSFNSQCGQRAYYESDMNAVLAGRVKEVGSGSQ